MTQLLALLLITHLAPDPMGELRRFPFTPEECLRNYLDAGAALADRRTTALPDRIGRAQVRYAEWVFACWDVLDNAKRCRKDYDGICYELARLRTLLGDEMYYRGAMPTVPLK